MVKIIGYETKTNGVEQDSFIEGDYKLPRSASRTTNLTNCTLYTLINLLKLEGTRYPSITLRDDSLTLYEIGDLQTLKKFVKTNWFSFTLAVLLGFKKPLKKKLIKIK